MLDLAHTITTDFLVGAGVAGLRAAIELAQSGKVVTLAKESLHESSSEFAQGGIAVALSDDDDVSLYEQDTIYGGGGLCNEAAVHTLVEDGPAAIQELIEWGTAFGREGLRLLFAREGARSRNRMVHAHGDPTGREIVRTLYRKAASLPNGEFHNFAAMTDLLLSDTGGVLGAAAFDESSSALVRLRARATLVATGGLGRVYNETTNPDVATGDGVPAAYRAGAEISDMEYVQFHPTAVHLAGAPRFLLSEPLHGEGGHLLNEAGERFMERYHPLQELAPRDVVARAIVQEIRRTQADLVDVDMTHLPLGVVESHFPRSHQTCSHYGIDLAEQPAPVHPAVHYAMGGVATDLDGKTGLAGLFAAGEAAGTGVHGANRLASNSLPEGVVFGPRAAHVMRDACPAKGALRPVCTAQSSTASVAALRKLIWDHCGILGDGPHLKQTLSVLTTNHATIQHPTRAHFELRSIHTVGLLIGRNALAREESPGAHYGLDFPEKQPIFQKHSCISLHHDVQFS